MFDTMTYQTNYTDSYNNYQSEYGIKRNDLTLPSNPTGFYDENSEYICDICKSHNFSGTVYHCKACLNGDFDICESCRLQGRSCFCGHEGNILSLRIIPGRGRKYGAAVPGATDVDPEEIAWAKLSDLLPHDTTINDPIENPELLHYYKRFLAYTDSHRNPPYNTFLCTSTREYEAWENECYNPQRSFYEQKIADFGEILADTRHFSRYNARSGSKGWEYQTQDGEVVDTLDFLMHLTIKLEETYKDLSDLTDEMNKQWASKEIHEANAAGNLQHVATCEKWFSRVVREETVNHQRSKYERLTETLKEVETAVKKARALEKYACDTLITKVMMEVNAIRTNSQFESKHDERINAADTIRHHYDIRKRLEERLFNFRKAQINAYVAYRLSENPQNKVAVESESDSSLNRAMRVKEEAIREISGEYDARVTKMLLPAVSGVSTNVHSLPQYSTASTNPSCIQSPLLPSQDANTIAHTVTSISNPTNTSFLPNPPKFQMPLSYYSNMLTQQHVVNMNVINNIAGGNTTYSVVNPMTGLKY